MDSIKREARSAGILYSLGCIIAPFALIYVPRALIVTGDATATADRVRASEALLRMGIAVELISPIIVIFAVLAFYRLFKRVSVKHAQAMAVLILISFPISFLNVLNYFAALALASGAHFLSAFDQRQLDALVYLFLRLHGGGLMVAGIFWGLWLFPFGVLIIRSGFIPRLVGVSVMIAGLGYLISSFAYVLLPQHARLVTQYTAVLAAGELPLLWALIWGAKEQPAAGEQASAAEASGSALSPTRP